MIRISKVFFFLALSGLFINLSYGQGKLKPFVPVGIFLGSIEEGARIFTPIRLLPFEHPESEGHQFPNALQLLGTEFNILLWLGRHSGYDLRTTLLRYPKEPSPVWPYREFSQLPDTTELQSISCFRLSKTKATISGLRTVLFIKGEPVGFIVDTRGLTLAERGMERPTSMGLDVSRSEFLTALQKAVSLLNGNDTALIIFEP